MAIVDKSGVTGRSLATHKERLEARYREQFGEDLSLAPYTVQAQLIGIAALWHAETDEQIVALGNMFSVETATGNQLDDIGSLVDVTRYRATHSRVTARLTGVAGTEVPAGSRARTSEFDQFEMLTDAVLSPAGVDIVLQALEPGPIVVEAGDLTHIVTVIAGWETITNASASSIGVAEQSDADYRSVYQVRTAHSSVGPLDALRGAILEAGATRIPRAVSNDTPKRHYRAGLAPGRPLRPCCRRGGERCRRLACGPEPQRHGRGRHALDPERQPGAGGSGCYQRWHDHLPRRGLYWPGFHRRPHGRAES